MIAVFLPPSAIALRGQRPQPPGRPNGSTDSAHRSAGHPVPERLGAAYAREALGLALQVPADRRLERVLVRLRGPAELALGLRVAVGPPLPEEAHLLRADRRAPARRELGRLRHRERDARGEPKSGRLEPGDASEVGEEAVERVVAVAEDVA